MALRYSSLGGSPLGIIGLFSVPAAGGRSGFNGPKWHNFDVNQYNTGKTRSMFSGNRRLRAWPNIKGSLIDADTSGGGTAEKIIDPTGLSDVQFPTSGEMIDNSVPSRIQGARGSNMLHNDSVYDTSVLNIVEKLSGTKAAVKMSDFAYLKNLGVYPNNRLMIARRFHSPSGDNIMVSRTGFPMATLISWVPPEDNFLEISFGEVWVEAKADFTGMLNALGEDFSKTGLGGVASAAANAVPLPGFTEIFQRQFLAKLGLLENSSANSIPAGNPNLIKEAKVRKTIGYGEAGAGMTAKVSIKMTCEYELKFISGIDPTIVWMDIVSNILRFGTSESSNYGLSGNIAAKLARWAANPYSLITDVVKGIKDAIDGAYDTMKKLLGDIKTAALKVAEELDQGTASTAAKKSDREIAEAAAKKAYDMGMKILNGLKHIAIQIIRASILKYRVEVMGIVNALTGNPSTPWHLTIGNPLRPTFCSGDMYTTEVTLRLGPNLAFNDLPSSIVAEFTLQNARALGLQELMSKFNSGYLRTVDVQKSFLETTITFTKEGTADSVEQPGFMPGETGGGPQQLDKGTTSGSDTSGKGTSGDKGTTSGDKGITKTNDTSGDKGTTSGDKGTTSGDKKIEIALTDGKGAPGSEKQGTKESLAESSKTEGGAVPVNSELAKKAAANLNQTLTGNP